MKFSTRTETNIKEIESTKTNPMRIFLEHPASVGETYFEHMIFALRFSGRLALASCAALAHAFIPALCEKTASNKVCQMRDELVNRGK